MTPPPATIAGTKRTAGPRRPGAPPQRANAASPRVPRRVSGPASPTPVGARTARAYSRPAAPTPRMSRTGARRVLLPPRLRAIPRPRLALEGLLDRTVRGRAWIPVLGVALVGIVTMQVEVLKLGSSVGRSMNMATELTSQIQIDRAQVSELASPERIERIAASYGLVEPGPTDHHFVSAHTSVSRAIAGIHPVDAATFTATLARERAGDDLAPTVAPTVAAPVAPTVAPTVAAPVAPTVAAPVAASTTLPSNGAATVSSEPSIPTH